MTTFRQDTFLDSTKTFITDGGLETTLVFEKGIDLPEFAAFLVLQQSDGLEILRNYYRPYLELARQNSFGFILESPTWRASSNWGNKLGLSRDALRNFNRQSIELMAELRTEYENETTPMVISACLGPQGDGYRIDSKTSSEEARQYHAEQIGTFSTTEADLVSAYTINYVEEAIGITAAAQDFGIPAVISFTLETDGRLPSGQPLGAAIEEVDGATNGGPLYYMINCAHPSHFLGVFAKQAPWQERIHAVRANASCKSHAELDESEELDSGDPVALSCDYVRLVRLLPNLHIFGGCCGTGYDHIKEICNRFHYIENELSGKICEIGKIARSTELQL